MTMGTGPCFPSSKGLCTPILRRECAEQLVGTRCARVRDWGTFCGRAASVVAGNAEITAPLLPADRPRYVMGVGMPEELAGIRGARRGYDGLRSAVTQRAKRVPVYQGGEDLDQADAI